MDPSESTPAIGDHLIAAGRAPIGVASPDELLAQPTYGIANQHCYLYPSYADFLSNAGGAAADGSPASITPGSDSISPTLTSSVEEEEYHNVARLSVQYRDIVENYELCLSHLYKTAEQAETLRLQNAELRRSNEELAKRLAAAYGRTRSRSAPPLTADELAGELNLFSIGEPVTLQAGDVIPPPRRPLSALAPENRAPLPKSISVRSGDYLKLTTPPNAVCAGGSASGRVCGRGRLHATTTDQRSVTPQLCLELGGNVTAAGAENEDGDGAVEFDLSNQGMFKTELCNKWEESGACPYGEQCQFAHGVTELRPVIRHPRYKTEVCRMVLNGDTCPYGHRCHFRHTLGPSNRFILRP